MKQTTATAMVLAMTGVAFIGTANAAVINVGNAAAGIQAQDRISASVTWTSNNTYNLLDQIYVTDGATLTIQPGTVIASTPTANGSGSLAITRGCRIVAAGTVDNPIIFTSTADVATWAPLPSHPTGKDPTTGTWRPQANEWGNVTIMGRAFISENVPAGNPQTCSVNGIGAMEGLTPPAGEPELAQYGGNTDSDDCGVLRYVSIRYAGRVVGLNNELNGLSLGGVGRNTDIDHIDIMNNVDDGIEIWGGTVNLKFVNIWNIGDDSFDIDQGWRGKAQFGVIAQGYAEVAAQGSGVGDNLFETDGAENSDAQPVTTATIYNFTAIGVPSTGDEGTAWRDNANIQYRNCIFMDLGENLVENNNQDGDGGAGYGFNGTLSYAARWTTPYTTTSLVNPCPAPNLTYQAQSAGDNTIGQGFLCEITDSIFFRNLNAAAYSNANGANGVGVTNAGGSNPAKGNVVAVFNAGSPDDNMPIRALVRGAPVVTPAGNVANIVSLDPRAFNAATSSNAAAPSDGFYTVANYRGGVGPTVNWLCGWTAASAFGYVTAGCAPIDTCLPDMAPGNGDNVVNTQDLLFIIGAWGACANPNNCPADIAPAGGDDTVNTQDLLAVIAGWGACP